MSAGIGGAASRSARGRPDRACPRRSPACTTSRARCRVRPDVDGVPRRPAWHGAQFWMKSSLPFPVLPPSMPVTSSSPPPARQAQGGKREEDGDPARHSLRTRCSGSVDALASASARVVNGEDPVQPRDLEDLGDVAVAADDQELPLVRPQRLTPPTSTPRVVESMKVVSVRSTTTCFPPFSITSRSCCLNSGAV